MVGINPSNFEGTPCLRSLRRSPSSVEGTPFEVLLINLKEQEQRETEIQLIYPPLKGGGQTFVPCKPRRWPHPLLDIPLDTTQGHPRNRRLKSQEQLLSQGPETQAKKRKQHSVFVFQSAWSKSDGFDWFCLLGFCILGIANGTLSEVLTLFVADFRCELTSSCSLVRRTSFDVQNSKLHTCVLGACSINL